MYELIIKILGEKDYRKFTIEELEEMKSILEQFKETEEVRLRRIKDVSIMGEEKTNGEPRKQLWINCWI